MNAEMIESKIESLENQLATIKKAINNQNTRINLVDEKSMEIAAKNKEQSNEVSRLHALINGMSQFETSLSKLRSDFKIQIEDLEKRVQQNIKIHERSLIEETKNTGVLIEKNRKDMNQNLEQKTKMINDEVISLNSKINEVAIKSENKVVGIDELRANFNLFQQEVRQYKKQLENFSIETDRNKKNFDDYRSKVEVLLHDLRGVESRIKEIMATENDRKQTQTAFIEQQTFANNERERIWTEWTNQFEESISQIYKLLPDLQLHQNDLKKNKIQFEDVSQRIERRINEITEMYRIMDEKFRKEWGTYKSDLEKRWTNISLVFDDKYGGYDNEIKKLSERIVEVEDDTKDMQEALILMSREIQKGMQSLMTMVNGWMDAFNQIKSP